MASGGPPGRATTSSPDLTPTHAAARHPTRAPATHTLGRVKKPPTASADRWIQAKTYGESEFWLRGWMAQAADFFVGYTSADRAWAE
jgi:hypothetical protein